MLRQSQPSEHDWINKIFLKVFWCQIATSNPPRLQGVFVALCCLIGFGLSAGGAVQTTSATYQRPAQSYKSLARSHTQIITTQATVLLCIFIFSLPEQSHAAHRAIAANMRNSTVATFTLILKKLHKTGDWKDSPVRPKPRVNWWQTESWLL